MRLIRGHGHIAMTSMYKKASILLTLACVAYMCLINVFQISLHTGHSQTRDQGRSLHTRDEGMHHGNKTRQIWTKKENIRAHTFLSTNQLNSHVSAQTRRKSVGDITNSSSFSTRDRVSIPWRESLGQPHPVTLRKLKENMQHQQIRTPHTSSKLAKADSPPNARFSHVSQYNVSFVPLGDNIYVFGTFLDRRFSNGPHIRILILQSTPEHSQQILCKFYNSQNRSVSIKAEPYEMCENHGKRYGGWIYSCQVPQTVQVIPQTLSLLSVIGDSLSLITVLVKRLDTPSDESVPMLVHNSIIQQHYHSDNDIVIKLKESISRPKSERINNIQTDFRLKQLPTNNNMSVGVCVPPLYGDICLTKIINFIEMCHLLGANKVFLYIHDIPKDIFAFLQNYTGLSANILTIVLWDLPVAHKKTPSPDTTQVIWNHGQLLAVQHCLYTNMANFQWLLFMDVDEMLIPQKIWTWPELIAGITRQFYSQFQQRSISGISFESAFFQQDFQTQASNSIDYFQYLYRTQETSLHRSKLFVQPSQVFEVGIHHISKQVAEDMDVIRAGPGLALLHHYRKCVSTDRDNGLNCEVLVKDETILRYEVPLTIASRDVIKGAMEFFAHSG